MTYDPNIGRWLEEDPIGFDAGDMNLYRFVSNDPTNNVDPTGEFGIKIVAALVWDSGWRFVTGEEPGVLVKVGQIGFRRVEVIVVSKAVARYHWTQLSYKYGDDAGKPISGMMFRLSLQDNPKKRVFRAHGSVVEAIKKCPEYKTLLDKLIREGKTQGKIGIDFTSNDLHTAIGKATVVFKDLRKVDKDNYEVKIMVHDRYNFEFHGLLYYKSGVAVSGANNLSWLSQYVDVINGYDWETEWFTEKKRKVP